MAGQLTARRGAPAGLLDGRLGGRSFLDQLVDEVVAVAPAGAPPFPPSPSGRPKIDCHSSVITSSAVRPAPSRTRTRPERATRAASSPTPASWGALPRSAARRADTTTV